MTLLILIFLLAIFIVLLLYEEDNKSNINELEFIAQRVIQFTKLTIFVSFFRYIEKKL